MSGTYLFLYVHTDAPCRTGTIFETGRFSYQRLRPRTCRGALPRLRGRWRAEQHRQERPCDRRHSTSFEELDPQNRNAMLQSVEIEKDMPRDFPLLNIGLASEAALHG